MYDPVIDEAYIPIAPMPPASVAESVPLGEGYGDDDERLMGIVLDLDEEGRLVGVIVQGARTMLPPGAVESMRQAS